MIRSTFLAGAALVLCSMAAGCRRSTSPPAIDLSLVSCVPPGTAILAGVHLDQLRASPLYGKLSPPASTFTETLRNASYVLLASSGSDAIAMAYGSFRDSPPGWEPVAPHIAIWGAPDAIRAARAQYLTGTTGAPDLLSRAQPLAALNPIWAVARGTATLPLTGNLSNLNRFLHSTDYTTAAARLSDTLSLNIAGICRSAADAQHLERTLRAFLSLATLRSPGALARANVALDERTVRLNLTADAADVERLLH